MILRPDYLGQIAAAHRRSFIAALLGPRQCGKTTLARSFAEGRPASSPVTFFDLESQPDRLRLQNPELTLDSLRGLVVLDEVQTMPELFPILRVLADRKRNPARFLILGSASPHLVKQSSETLAGRVEFIELSGFGLSEIGAEAWQRLWLRGGFPRSYLARSDADSFAWREGFIRTFLERDIPQLGIRIAAPAMRRFWTMLAHYHGQTWNASEIGRAMGLTDKTVRGYLDLLTQTYMVRQLQPWFENLGKRQVKAPRVFFRDTGLLHHLLGIPNRHYLLAHPKVGASWEGFAIEQILQLLGSVEPYFWSTHGGSELDLILIHAGRRVGFEVKFSEAPRLTLSMREATKALGLAHLWVIHPGPHRFPMDQDITALPIHELSAILT